MDCGRGTTSLPAQMARKRARSLLEHRPPTARVAHARAFNQRAPLEDGLEGRGAHAVEFCRRMLESAEEFYFTGFVTLGCRLWFCAATLL